MNKYLTIAATVALGLGIASAQTAPTTAPVAPAPATAAPATSAQVTNFTDIPAGHWAKDAVDLIVQRGLIQGFPDGTFRGNENLTRYQAALIFARLLQSGALSSGSVSSEDVATITKGMQDVATELAAVSTRVSDLEKLTADQQARLTALEGQIANVNTGDSAALTARIDALETAVKNIPAGPQGPAGPAGASADVTDLTNRVAALEARASTSTSTTVTTTPAPETVVIGPDTTTTEGGNSGLYAGITTSANFNGGSYGFGNNSTNNNLPFYSSFGATVGASQVIYGLGVRANVDYSAQNSAISGDINATYALGNGSRFTPYVGVGFGVTSSNTIAAPTTAKSTDYYINGIIGAEGKVVGNLSLFGEFDGKYYLTSKGQASSNSSNAANVNYATDQKYFLPTAKIGLKYYF